MLYRKWCTASNFSSGNTTATTALSGLKKLRETLAYQIIKLQMQYWQLLERIIIVSMLKATSTAAIIHCDSSLLALKYS